MRYRIILTSLTCRVLVRLDQAGFVRPTRGSRVLEVQVGRYGVGRSVPMKAGRALDLSVYGTCRWGKLSYRFGGPQPVPGAYRHG